MMDLEEVLLTLPEFEAIRLVDSDDVPQEKAGEMMEVSQATMSRILRSGRKKIADALRYGKAIKIEDSSVS